MQEDTTGRTVVPNRKERRRLAALAKRPARSACACCQPIRREDDSVAEPDGESSLSQPSLA